MSEDNLRKKRSWVVQLSKNNNWYGFATMAKYRLKVNYPEKGYTEKKAQLLSESELDGIIQSFKEYQDICKAQEIKARWYNNPEYAADAPLWSKYAYWTLDEAILLLLGKDPGKLKIEYINKVAINDAFREKFNKIKEIAQRHIILNQLTNPPTPGEFLAWAERIFPEEIFLPVLKEMLVSSGVIIADWRGLYERQQKVLNQTNGLLDTYQSRLKMLEQEKEEFLEKTRDLIEPDHEYYSSELDIANMTQRWLINNPCTEGSIKSWLENYLINSYPELSESARERISVMVNPNQKKLGGRPKIE